MSDGWEREGDQAEKGLFWDSDSALHDSHTCQSPLLSSLSCKPWPLGNEVSIAMRESKPTSMVPEEAVPVREEEHMGIPSTACARLCVGQSRLPALSLGNGPPFYKVGPGDHQRG